MAIAIPSRLNGVANSASLHEQGEKSVGAATVQLVSSPLACSFVWVGAPTANHTVGEANTGNILIGKESTGNASGGMVLAATDTKGFLILCNDASKLFLTGFNAGDVVEYQIWI